MKAGFLEYLTWWGPYIVGALAIAYAVVLKLGTGRAADDGAREKCPTALLILAGISLAAALLLIGLLAVPKELSWRYAVVFLIGGVGALLTFLYSHWRSWSAVSSSSAVFFGVGLGVLEMAFFRNYFREAPMIYLFVAALGIWLMATLLSYGGSSRLAQGTRSLALTSSVIAAGVALGIYHYPRSAMGSLFAVDICALALLLSLLASLLAGIGGRLRSFAAPAAAIALLGLVWWLGVLLAGLLINDSRGGLCVLVGAAAVLLLYWLSAASDDAQAGPRVPLMGTTEAGVLAVLIAVAALAMSMRWLAGYGISLAAIGGLAALPLIYLTLERASTTEPAAASDRRAAGAWAVAALAAAAYVRVFLEATSGHGLSVDLFETYTVPGLVLGGSLVLMLASLAGERSRRGCTGPISAFSTGLAAVVLGCGIVLAVAYFWRLEAVNGLVIGIAAGVFYTILAAALSQVSNEAAGLVMGVPLFIVTLMPAFLDRTLNLTRGQKVHVLLWLLGGMALVMIVTSSVRIILAGREAQAQHSPQQ